MTPSPDLIAAVLALPLESRRLLALQPGPGWQYHAEWCRTPVLLCSSGLLGDAALDVGWAWLPADSAAWMDAATPEGGRWARHTDGDWDVFGPAFLEGCLTPICYAPTAPLCALAALRARFGVTP